jgi:hypothetical protein
MQVIRAQGYLPGYSGNAQYQFTRLFDRKVTVNFDTVTLDATADFRVLVQCEPPELYQDFASMVQANQQHFDLILTYDPRLLNLPQAQEFCPVGTWIDPGIELHKQDEISYIMSSKVYTWAHRMRFMILRRYGNLDHIGAFCFRMHRSPPRIASKNLFFAHAKFNIACENDIIPNMYTEKLLDCFQTRTVPIYYGCTNLEQYFDTRGVIQFWNIEQLEQILANLTPADYDARLPYIEENYQRARPFWENTVYERIENIVAGKLGL